MTYEMTDDGFAIVARNPSFHQVRAHCAYLARTFALISKSKVPFSEDLDFLRDRTAHYLEHGLLVYHPSLEQELGIGHDDKLIDRRFKLGFEPRFRKQTEAQKRLNARMGDEVELCRQAEWRYRIGQHVARIEALPDWYCYFATLTVAETEFDAAKVFGDTKALNRWFRTLAKRCAVSAGHKVAKSAIRIKDYVCHVGTVEHGKSRDHHHMHVIFGLYKPPPEFLIDPNAGRRGEAAVKTDIPSLCTDWQWSHGTNSRGGPFRTLGDKWSAKLGFVTPVVNGKALEMLCPEDAGGYLAKYILKDDKEFIHRVRCSQSVGFFELDRYLYSIDFDELSKLAETPRDYKSFVGCGSANNVPGPLLRRRAKDILDRRLFDAGELDFEAKLGEPENYYGAIARKFEFEAHQYADMMRVSEFFETLMGALPPTKASSDAIVEANGRIGGELGNIKGVSRVRKLAGVSFK